MNNFQNLDDISHLRTLNLYFRQHGSVFQHWRRWRIDFNSATSAGFSFADQRFRIGRIGAAKRQYANQKTPRFFEFHGLRGRFAVSHLRGPSTGNFAELKRKGTINSPYSEQNLQQHFVHYMERSLNSKEEKYWSTRPTTVPAGSYHYFHTCPSVRPSVRPAQNFKIKRQSLPAGTVGWPSGSWMTPVLFIFVFSLFPSLTIRPYSTNDK